MFLAISRALPASRLRLWCSCWHCWCKWLSSGPGCCQRCCGCVRRCYWSWCRRTNRALDGSQQFDTRNSSNFCKQQSSGLHSGNSMFKGPWEKYGKKNGSCTSLCECPTAPASASSSPPTISEHHKAAGRIKLWHPVHPKHSLMELPAREAEKHPHFYNRNPADTPQA